MTKGIIALDADGVLLDYNLAYAGAWERAFGIYPKEKDPDAYWAIDRWEVERLSGERLDQLRASFDEMFWETVPAMEGAVQACHALRAAGFDLVCVTALPDRFALARRNNLRQLGFPIETVIATDNVVTHKSPKADVLHALRPVAFVDDFLPSMLICLLSSSWIRARYGMTRSLRMDSGLTRLVEFNPLAARRDSMPQSPT